ncbi:NAD(P)-dependent alcohol dehydrogenase [Streptomyces sp. B21-083]|uniref:NAD(P)-dependent alcohol dehydrogenase n=1 Tax=Streptomyces sp. B21-083 TaxID=3039410 RepID=UPI002FF0258B
MRVQAAVVEEKSGPFLLQELELDEPRADEILVRIEAVGICQTDIHIQHQNLPVGLPYVLGHEGAGVVERVGAAVTSVAPGDHVVLSFQSCGHCAQCLSGKPSYCELALPANFVGARLDGTRGIHRPEGNDGPPVLGHFFGQSSFATYALTTERNTVKVPKDIPLEVLAPLGCGLQTGAGTVLNSLDLQRGQSIAVIGTGTVGLAAIMAAKAAGAGTIIGIDINDDRLKTALELGATHTVNGSEKDVTAEIRAITGGRGVDAVVELTGRPEQVASALAAIATRGTVALVGSPTPGVKAELEMINFGFGGSVRGVVQGDSVPQLFIPQLIDMYRAGIFPFDRLLSHYDFDDINTAVADTRQGKAIKPVLRIGATGR